jgi:RimJ/RimL family protein N-acetyltransferase
MIKLLDLYQAGQIRPGALEFLYKMMEERQTEPEVNISYKELPSFEHHRAFWTRRPYRFTYLIEPSDYLPRDDLSWQWAGYVSATARNEIGIVLLQAWRGHGIGPQAVQALLERHKPNPAVPSECSGCWLANVAPGNERSRRMFEKLGFRKIQETYALEEGDTHGTEKGPAAPA